MPPHEDPRTHRQQNCGAGVTYRSEYRKGTHRSREIRQQRKRGRTLGHVAYLVSQGIATSLRGQFKPKYSGVGFQKILPPPNEDPRQAPSRELEGRPIMSRRKLLLESFSLEIGVLCA